VSHHSYWVNSKALEIAGITADTPDPDGGSIVRNEAGEPSGLLTDAAKNLVAKKIEVPYSVENMAKAYEAFQDYCHELGITGLTNINLSGIELIHAEALHNMDAKGDLHLRQRFLVWGQPGMGYEGIKEKLDAVAGYESDMFQTGTVKIVYDGVTEGATAVMLEPYLPAAGKGEGWTATSDWSIEEFNRVVADLDKNGYQVHTHAIGDGAVHASLDAYEQAAGANGKRDARHTMVHVCAITPEDILRAADLDVVCDLQFLWMYNDPLCHLETAFIGQERAFAMYPAKDMLEAGCILSGGSDGAVTAYDPLLEIEVGITRNSPFPGEEDEDFYRWPEQGLTAYQMLEMYTKNVAYENYMEDIVGTVEVGKKADFVVLDQNILDIDPKNISETKVVYTVSNGDIVYEA
jgi:predicted amidohydrolase YtcJ